MHSKSNLKLNTFSLFLGASGLLGLLAGCPVSDPTLPGINQDPTANAGVDRTPDVGQRVILDGRGSTDADDDALTFIWQQRSGPPVTLDGANTAQPSFVPVEDGFYEFALTVTDDRGGSDISVVRVFVGIDPPPTCPRADAGTNRTVNEGAAVRLRGGNSADPGGGPLTFDWFQLSGPQVSINGVFIVEPSFAAPQATGADVELEFELTVTNEHGCPDRDTVVITVRDRDPSDPCNGVVCPDDGQFCNGVEICENGDCLSSGDPCLVDETCDEETDACVDLCEGVDCDDGNECTDDSCVDGACVHENNTAACDDGDNCTENDACADGVCAGTPVDCPEGETCVDGVCVPCVAAADCDDGDACTDDSCVDGVCANDAVVCDDDDLCTDNSCDSDTGDCVFDAVVCPEGEVCDPVTGACVEECTCDDDDECTTDTCLADGSCSHDAVDCDDGDLCTTDTCNSPTGCANDPVVCPEGESCDPETGECQPGVICSDTIQSAETVTCAIDPQSDLDSWSFTGNVGDTVVIQMSRASGALNPRIDLFAPSSEGAAEAGAGTSDRSAANTALLIGHQLAESGLYTIVVRDVGANETGNYNLSLLLIPGATTSPQDPDGGVIAFGETKFGIIDLQADTDAYTFTGLAGQVVIIQMSRASGALNPRIDLFAPSGGAAEAGAGTSDLNSANTALLNGHQLAESGQYTIVVRDVGANETGDYNLSLSVLP